MTGTINLDLSNGDVGDAGGAVGVGAGEGEDFVKLFAKGGGEGAGVVLEDGLFLMTRRSLRSVSFTRTKLRKECLSL